MKISFFLLIALIVLIVQNRSLPYRVNSLNKTQAMYIIVIKIIILLQIIAYQRDNEFCEILSLLIIIFNISHFIFYSIIYVILSYFSNYKLQLKKFNFFGIFPKDFESIHKNPKFITFILIKAQLSNECKTHTQSEFKNLDSHIK